MRCTQKQVFRPGTSLQQEPVRDLIYGFFAHYPEKIEMLTRNLLIAAASMVVSVGTAGAAEVDASAAEALLKKSGCFKCHAVDKKRDGPSFKETAAKYKGKADGVDKVTKQITTSPKIKVDGVEETHDALKTKDAKDIRNAVDWILSR